MNSLKKFRRFGLALAGICVVFAVPAAASEQPLTPMMDCASVKNVVKTRGAVILRTGAHLYDRYVDNDGFCPTMMRTEAAWVPTRDNPQCFIGYTCEQTNSRRWR